MTENLEKKTTTKECGHALVRSDGAMSDGVGKDIDLYTCLYCGNTMADKGLIEIKHYEKYIKAGGVQLYFRMK